MAGPQLVCYVEDKASLEDIKDLGQALKLKLYLQQGFGPDSLGCLFLLLPPPLPYLPWHDRLHPQTVTQNKFLSGILSQK